MHRQHIFLTGQPGVGKSTCIQRVLQALQLPPNAATGFWTEEVRDSSTGERSGFDVVTLDGRRSVLSRVGTARRVRVLPGNSLLVLLPQHTSALLLVSL
jgi:nucleoside-triphosphatase